MAKNKKRKCEGSSQSIIIKQKEDALSLAQLIYDIYTGVDNK